MSRAKLLLLWLVCMAAGVVSALWMLCAIAAGSSRAWGIAKGYDCLANETFGDDLDKYISSRCWRYRIDPWYAQLVRAINWLAGDPDHCKSSYESERLRFQSPLEIGNG